MNKKANTTLILKDVVWEVSVEDVIKKMKAAGMDIWGLDEKKVEQEFAKKSDEEIFAFMGLPTRVEVPSKIADLDDDEALECWLKETYGFSTLSCKMVREMSQRRAVELLNYLLKHVSAGEDASETVKMLAGIGYEREDLIFLGYDAALLDENDIN